MIPDIVLRDNRLTANAKILFGKIICISGQKGFCDYTNAQLSTEMRVDTRTIQRYLMQIESCGYAMVSLSGDGLKDRCIYLNTHGDSNWGEVPVVTAESNGSYDFSAANILHSWSKELKDSSEYWGMPYRERKVTDTRLRKVIARLNEGTDTQLLLDAIRGCVWNEFNIKGGHTDIELICRNMENVERYALKWDAIKRARIERKSGELVEFAG